MLIQDDKKHVADLINSSKKCLVVASPNRGVDSLSAAIAFLEFVKTFSNTADIIYPGNPPQELKNITDNLAIKKKLDPKSLVISIDYKDTPIEKLNYFIEDEVLKLVVNPIPAEFDLNRVSFSFTGKRYDLIAIIGATTLEDLGSLYLENKDDFEGVTILNIDNSKLNTNYGAINVVEYSFNSLVELMFNKLALWGYKPSKLAAKSLLTGFEASEMKKSDVREEAPSPKIIKEH